MKNIINKITATLIIAILMSGSVFAQAAEQSLKKYQDRTNKDIKTISATSADMFGGTGYVITAIVAAGSVGALWAIHTKMLRSAVAKKFAAEDEMLIKALQARDAALELAEQKNARIVKSESSRRLAEKAKANAEGALLQERQALDIVKRRLDKTYQTNLLEGAAYIHAYRTQTPAFARHLDIGGPDRVYVNIESFELKENIKVLAADKKTAAFAKQLQALLESLPKDGSDISVNYYVKKAEIYNSLKSIAHSPKLKFWLEETIVKEDLPFILSASKNMSTFVESVRDYEARGQVNAAREVIEKAVKEEPAMARILPRTFKRFGTVAVLFAGAFALNTATVNASQTHDKLARLRSNPELFLKADGNTLAAAQKDKELTNALILMSNSIHELAIMPKAQMRDVVSSVVSEQTLKKKQINLSVPLKKPVDFSRYGNLSGF